MIRCPMSAVVIVLCVHCELRADDDAALPRQAAGALREAVRFFTEEVSAEGGYLWRYSEDLTSREGEGRASHTTVWVQPPGTPGVGMALLAAYAATGENGYLAAARRAGECLAAGQLRSGGWDHRIELDPAKRGRYAYRADPPSRSSKQRNTTTLDDNTTQAALRLLMRLDRALDFQDRRVREAAACALRNLVAVQYPIGAWPQRFTRPDPAATGFPVRGARYPRTWSRTFPGKDYKGFYTLNDNAVADTIGGRVNHRYANAAGGLLICGPHAHPVSLAPIPVAGRRRTDSRCSSQDPRETGHGRACVDRGADRTFPGPAPRAR